jgi:hypothetical protein
MNRRALILFLLILPVIAERPSIAAPLSGLPSISISAADTDIALGDSVSIRCTVFIPSGADAGEPSLMEENPSVEMERRSFAEDAVPSGRLRRYDFLAYVFSPDSVRIGPFAARCVTAAGDSGAVESNVIVLPVRGFLKNPQAPPRPNRDPFEITGKGFPLWVYAIIAALAAVIAVWLFRKRKRRPAPAPVIERPLDEIGEFERIRAMRLDEEGRIKELYVSVSAAMRGFAHRNMGFDAMFSTTEEIRRKLTRASKHRETAGAILTVLEEADMVNFARYVPPEELSATVIDRAIAPVRKVLDQIAAERERERAIEEERRRTANMRTAPDKKEESR